MTMISNQFNAEVKKRTKDIQTFLRHNKIKIIESEAKVHSKQPYLAKRYHMILNNTPYILNVDISSFNARYILHILEIANNKSVERELCTTQTATEMTKRLECLKEGKEVYWT